MRGPRPRKSSDNLPTNVSKSKTNNTDTTKKKNKSAKSTTNTSLAKANNPAKVTKSTKTSASTTRQKSTGQKPTTQIPKGTSFFWKKVDLKNAAKPSKTKNNTNTGNVSEPQNKKDKTDTGTKSKSSSSVPKLKLSVNTRSSSPKPTSSTKQSSSDKQASLEKSAPSTESSKLPSENKTSPNKVFLGVPPKPFHKTRLTSLSATAPETEPTSTATRPSPELSSIPAPSSSVPETKKKHSRAERPKATHLIENVEKLVNKDNSNTNENDDFNINKDKDNTDITNNAVNTDKENNDDNGPQINKPANNNKSLAISIETSNKHTQGEQLQKIKKLEKGVKKRKKAHNSTHNGTGDDDVQNEPSKKKKMNTGVEKESEILKLVDGPKELSGNKTGDAEGRNGDLNQDDYSGSSLSSLSSSDHVSLSRFNQRSSYKSSIHSKNRISSGASADLWSEDWRSSSNLAPDIPSFRLGKPDMLMAFSSCVMPEFGLSENEHSKTGNPEIEPQKMGVFEMNAEELPDLSMGRSSLDFHESLPDFDSNTAATNNNDNATGHAFEIDNGLLVSNQQKQRERGQEPEVEPEEALGLSPQVDEQNWNPYDNLHSSSSSSSIYVISVHNHEPNHDFEILDHPDQENKEQDESPEALQQGRLRERQQASMLKPSAATILSSPPLPPQSPPVVTAAASRQRRRRQKRKLGQPPALPAIPVAPSVSNRTRRNITKILIRNGAPIPVFIQFKAKNRTQLAQDVRTMSGGDTHGGIDSKTGKHDGGTNVGDLIDEPTPNSLNFTDVELAPYVSETLRWNEFKFYDVKFLEDCRRFGRLMDINDYLIYDPETSKVVPRPIDQIDAGVIDSDSDSDQGNNLGNRNGTEEFGFDENDIHKSGNSNVHNPCFKDLQTFSRLSNSTSSTVLPDLPRSRLHEESSFPKPIGPNEQNNESNESEQSRGVNNDGFLLSLANPGLPFVIDDESVNEEGKKLGPQAMFQPEEDAQPEKSHGDTNSNNKPFPVVRFAVPAGQKPGDNSLYNRTSSKPVAFARISKPYSRSLILKTSKKLPSTVNLRYGNSYTLREDYTLCLGVPQFMEMGLTQQQGFSGLADSRQFRDNRTWSALYSRWKDHLAKKTGLVVAQAKEEMEKRGEEEEWEKETGFVLKDAMKHWERMKRENKGVGQQDESEGAGSRKEARALEGAIQDVKHLVANITGQSDNPESIRSMRVYSCLNQPRPVFTAFGFL